MQRRLNLLAKSFGILVLLFVLLTGGLLIYLKNMDFNAYKPLFKQAVLEATGRNMEIDGAVELDFSLHPFLIVEGLHLANAATGSRANMINVGRMELQLSLLPLLSGELEIDKLVFVAPEILLERLPSGADNWSFETEPAPAAEAHRTQVKSGSDDAILLPQLRRLLIRDARILYRDRAAGEDISLQFSELEMWQLKDEKRLSLRAKGALNHRDLEFSAKIDDLSKVLLNQPIKLVFDAKLAGLDISLNGSVAKPLDAQGFVLNALLNSDSMQKLAEIAGIQLPRDFPLKMQLMIKDKTNGFSFSNIAATANNNDISGHLSLNLAAKRPLVDGVLRSKTIDVRQFLAVVEKGKSSPVNSDKNRTVAKQGGKKRLLPTQIIDFSALAMLDLNLGLKVKHLLLPDQELTELDIQIHLAKGTLKVAPLAFAIAKGKVSGSVMLESKKAVPRLSLNLQLANIHPAVLLPVEKGQQALIKGVQTNAEIRLIGQGKSVAEIMAHADGLLLLKLGEGRIQSQAMRLIGGDLLMNLVNTVNPFAKKMNYNELKCGVVHFRIKNGEMRTRDGIAFETDHMNIISSGHVNLASEKIDLSIRTETREGLGLNITNMVNVVKLGGTLAEPGMAVDVMKTGMAAARTVGAIASGGLSLLGESLFNRVTADSKPCETALEMAN